MMNRDTLLQRALFRKRTAGALLTEAEVKRIKGLLAQGVSRREIGKLFRVATETIARIARGDTWGWVEAGEELSRIALEADEIEVPPSTPELDAKADESRKRFEERMGINQPAKVPNYEEFLKGQANTPEDKIAAKFAEALDKAKQPERDLEKFKENED